MGMLNFVYFLEALRRPCLCFCSWSFSSEDVLACTIYDVPREDTGFYVEKHSARSLAAKLSQDVARNSWLACSYFIILLYHTVQWTNVCFVVDLLYIQIQFSVNWKAYFKCVSNVRQEDPQEEMFSQGLLIWELLSLSGKESFSSEAVIDLLCLLNVVLIHQLTAYGEKFVSFALMW